MKVDELCDDFLAERAELTALLAPLDEAAWRTPTPAPGWSILDQVTHLAWFDEACRQALLDPDTFLTSVEHALADVDGFVDEVTRGQRHLTGEQALAWLQHTGAEYSATSRTVDGSLRVPWYGPSMSHATSVTARIMETWAHGQDIADTLGVVRRPTDRLRHVAFLGSRAMANSYVAQGRRVPDTTIRIELVGPSGESWAFGPEGATDAVHGSALDFCLVVTQRRHPADTALVADGPVAREWLEIAQAFAGPPGAGRTEGQFT